MRDDALLDALAESFRRAPYDSRPDGSGLDDGVWLPGHEPRKKPAPKPPDVTAEIRARAWATRRRNYGEGGTPMITRRRALAG